MAVVAQPLSEASSLRRDHVQDPANGSKAAKTLVKQPLGPGVLIFGCRNSSTDFLYCDTVKVGTNLSGQPVMTNGAIHNRV